MSRAHEKYSERLWTCCGYCVSDQFHHHLCYVSQETTGKEQRDPLEHLGRNKREWSFARLSSASSSATDEHEIERMVCWDLKKRGDVGETALHLALLLSCRNPNLRKIAVALLNAFPRLCVDYYEDDEYYGRVFQLYTSNQMSHNSKQRPTLCPGKK